MTSRLIEERGDKQCVSYVRECSAAKAPIVALAEYLRTLEFPISGGKADKLTKVLITKAEPEKNATYPCAAVFTEGAIDYLDSDTTLDLTHNPSEDSGDLALLGCGEVRQVISVHIWTTEEPHRDNALQMMEDAMDPVEWMAGFMLEMPHYYNLRAIYSVERVAFEDTPDDNMHRYRKLMLSVKSSAPRARVVRLPRLRPGLVLDVRSGT